MDEATLERRLEGLSPPGLEAAATRAALAARVRFGVQPAEGAAPRRRRPAARLALAVGLLIVLAAALTPPGQAAVDWVGQKVGIGRPGGQPTLETLRRSWERGATGSEGAPAFVLASGLEPAGGHYELVTFERPSEEARCFEIEMTRERSGFGLGCERLPGAQGRPLDPPLPATGGLQATWGGNADPDQGFRYVAGRVSDDVDSVSVSFNGRAVETELVSIPTGLLDELGIERPFKFFIGFPADWQASGRFEVNAEGAAGKTVGHKTLEVPAAEMLTPAAIERLRREGGAGG